MFIYNITMKVDNQILDQWLAWQKEEHIPEVMATNLFHESRFYKLLEQDDTEGSTYVVQYYTNSKEDYDRYIQDYAPALREKALNKWGNHFAGFRTIMQAVQ